MNEKQTAMDALRLAIASHAVGVTGTASAHGLDLPLVTIIARHPDNDSLYIVESNDDLLAEPVELMMQFRQGRGK